VGVEPFRQRVAEDLARSGLRPASRTARGSLALTEREQDVATLVAKGLTNREVAGELYVSEKAVGYHLRNVFGKLGISSRREPRDRRNPRAQGQRPERLPARCRLLRDGADRHRRR
jgi:DNA-binding NarL/FixJ family response regulator